MVTRLDEIIPPRGSTRLAPGNHGFLVARSAVRELVDRAFAPRGGEPEPPLPAVEFPLSPRTRVAELVEFYGIEVDAAPLSTLELLVNRLGERGLTVGTLVRLGNVFLSVREVSADGIEVEALQVLP